MRPRVLRRPPAAVGLKGGTWRDAVTGQERTIADGGTLSFHVNDGSAAVWILHGPGKVGEDGPWLR